jgi:hypothetical protein
MGGGGQGRVAPGDEAIQACLEGSPLEKDVPPAGPAAEANVGTEAIDEPDTAAARVGASELDDIAEQQGQDGSVRHRREGIRGSAGRGPG